MRQLALFTYFLYHGKETRDTVMIQDANECTEMAHSALIRNGNIQAVEIQYPYGHPTVYIKVSRP